MLPKTSADALTQATLEHRFLFLSVFPISSLVTDHVPKMYFRVPAISQKMGLFFIFFMNFSKDLKCLRYALPVKITYLEKLEDPHETPSMKTRA